MTVLADRVAESYSLSAALLAAATCAEAGECQQAQRGRRRLGSDLIADGAAREADEAPAFVDM